MGQLYQLWDLDHDPDDAAAPYTPYTFIPAGHTGVPGMSLSRDFARRESVVVIPSADSVLDGNGRAAGAIERRDFTAGFRVIIEHGGDLDAAYDLLAAQLAPGVPQRLVYLTDSGTLRFTIGSNPAIRHTLTAANKGMVAYADFTCTWRIRPDWRPRYQDAADIWGIGDGTWGTADGTWGQGATVSLVDTGGGLTQFLIDATGIAGSTLPTLPDTGPVVDIHGPAGGAGGLTILNFAATERDAVGNPTPQQFTVPKLLAGQEIKCDFARQRFTLAGVPFRPTKPNYQRGYLRIAPGTINTIQALPVGGGATFGGSILITWWRKTP